MPRSLAPRWRTAGRTAALLALLATLLLAGPRAEAADQASPAVAISAESAPEFALAGFRWERPSVPVYANWEGGTCVFAGNNFTGPATAIPTAVLEETLRASIQEINTHLRGGLVLQYAGSATRAELCSASSTRPIVIGFGAIRTTGEAISFGSPRGGPYAAYTAARVFLQNTSTFSCPSAPTYRDLQLTMTHELLHAIGIGHSQDRTAIMAPTFVACRASNTMQADDIAAVNALYPPTLPATATATATAVPSAVPTAPPSVLPAGQFRPGVTFSAGGQALTVFVGGDAASLEAAALGVGAGGAWVQDAGGTFRLLVANGPTFLRDEFRAAFPAGIPANTAVTLVR